MAAKKRYEQKSFWTGIVAIVAGVAGFATHTMDVATVIQTVIGGIAVIFIRDAIESTKQP